MNSLEQRAGPPIRAIVIAPMLHCIWTTVRHHFIAWRETASQANTFKCNGDGLLSIAFWTEAGYRFPHNYTSLLPPTFYHRWRREGNLTIGLPAGRYPPNLRSTDRLLPGGRAIIHLIIGEHGTIGTRNAGDRSGNTIQEAISFAQGRANAFVVTKGLRHTRNIADGHPHCYSAVKQGRVISARLL